MAITPSILVRFLKFWCLNISALLNDLYAKANPRALLLHDLGDALHKPAFRCCWVKSSEVILSVTRHQLLVTSVDLIIAPGPMERPGPRVSELTLPPVAGEGGLDHLGPEFLAIAHVLHIVTVFRNGVSKDRPGQLSASVGESPEHLIGHCRSFDMMVKGQAEQPVSCLLVVAGAGAGQGEGQHPGQL